jgi:hypothetical protein
MRYASNDKYTIAWFKLAECVAKGEKEKAFGVYRLLKHSLDDEAYAYQLEGDLLGAFQDERATEKYAYAAQLYYQNNRFKEAADLYEELFLFMPENEFYVSKLIDVYRHNKSNQFFTNKLFKVVDILKEKQVYHSLILIFEQLQETDYCAQLIPVYVDIVVQVIKRKENNASMIAQLIECIMQELVVQESYTHMRFFLSRLEQTDEYWYKKACAYIKDAPE